MQNLQKFLRKTREQGEKLYTACLTKYSKRVLAVSMAVVVGLAALPVIDGIFSVNVQAATTEEGAEALLEYVAEAEQEEAMEVTQADSNDIMIPSLKLAASVDEEIKKLSEEPKEKNDLEMFGDVDDGLLETDILVEEEVEEPQEEQTVVVLKTVEEIFYESLDYDSIPAELNVNYNPDFKMDLSEEELTVLETIVEAEAGGEDVYGRMLVANVVLNRVLSDGFPDTVKEVVFQNNGKVYQFSPVRSGGRYYKVKVSECTRDAVARVLNGEDYSEGALFFFARKLTSKKQASWFDTELDKIVRYGCHEFFKNK